jgi:hypothetical protein
VTCRLLLGGLGGGAGLAAASGATAKQRRAAAAAAVACASVALRASAAGCCQTWTWPPSWPGRAQSLDASAAKAAAAAAIAPAAEAHAAHLLRAVVRSGTLDALGALELLRAARLCVSRCAGFEGGIDGNSFDLLPSLPASSSSRRSFCTVPISSLSLPRTPVSPPRCLRERGRRRIIWRRRRRVARARAGAWLMGREGRRAGGTIERVTARVRRRRRRRARRPLLI